MNGGGNSIDLRGQFDAPGANSSAPASRVQLAAKGSPMYIVKQLGAPMPPLIKATLPNVYSKAPGAPMPTLRKVTPPEHLGLHQGDRDIPPSLREAPEYFSATALCPRSLTRLI